MREHLTAKRAWATLAVGVAAYELYCKDNELLSEGVDRALEHSPLSRIATLTAIGVTALHLANMLPEEIDPYHQLHRLSKRM